MNKNKPYPTRKSPRLPEYDYVLVGGYFITIVTHDRKTLFGDVVDEEMRLNEVGEMIQREWLAVPDRFPSIVLDEFIVMPNHFHGILFIQEPDVDVGAGLVPARHQMIDENPERATTRVAPTLSEVIGAFKSKTTNHYINGVKELGWIPFEKHFWQRSYYDRIIRDDKELHNLRDYTRYNTLKWLEDEENPDMELGIEGMD